MMRNLTLCSPVLRVIFRGSILKLLGLRMTKVRPPPPPHLLTYGILKVFFFFLQLYIEDRDVLQALCYCLQENEMFGGGLLQLREG